MGGQGGESFLATKKGISVIEYFFLTLNGFEYATSSASRMSLNNYPQSLG